MKVLLLDTCWMYWSWLLLTSWCLKTKIYSQHIKTNVLLDSQSHGHYVDALHNWTKKNVC